MKKSSGLALTSMLLLLLPYVANTQSIPSDYLQRVAILGVNGSGTQLGLAVGERNNRIYIVTVKNSLVDEYPPIEVTLGQNTTATVARWYKDDKSLSKSKLMLLSVPKPANYRLPTTQYFTRLTEGQSISIPTENRQSIYALRIVRSQPNRISLNPVSQYSPNNEDALIGAPLYLQDRGFVGLLVSPVATNIEAYSIGVIRDALQSDDADLFNLQNFNRDGKVTFSPKEDPSPLIFPTEEPASQTIYQTKPQQPVDMKEALKRPFLQLGIDFAYYFISKPTTPAFTPQKEPISGHIGLGLNINPIRILTLRVSPRYNARTALFAKDPKYDNYALTQIQVQSAELATGLEINLSSNSNTFFFHLGGSVSKPIRGEYEYILQSQTYTVSLRDDQENWQKAAIGGIGARTGGLRLLLSYYYGLDPYINDDELSNTTPKVTPFKQQKTQFQYLSIEAGLYF